VAVENKFDNNRNDLESISEELESQGHVIDSGDVIPASQPFCLNPSDKSFFEGAEKRTVDDCLPLAHSELSTAFSNSYRDFSGTGTQATTNHLAQASQEQSNHERNVESLTETGLNVNLQQDLVELMDDFPAEPIFSMADFDDFLRVLNSPPHLDGDDLSNPVSVAELETTLDQLRLASTSSSSPNPVTSSSEGSTQGAKPLKRIQPSPDHEKAKKRRMAGAERLRLLRPTGKPARGKSSSPLTPCHSMTLRSQEMRMALTPRRLGFVAEESPSQRRGRKSWDKMQAQWEQEKQKTPMRTGKRQGSDSDPEYCTPRSFGKKDMQPNSKKSKFWYYRFFFKFPLLFFFIFD